MGQPVRRAGTECGGHVPAAGAERAGVSNPLLPIPAVRPGPAVTPGESGERVLPPLENHPRHAGPPIIGERLPYQQQGLLFGHGTVLDEYIDVGAGSSGARTSDLAPPSED